MSTLVLELERGTLQNLYWKKLGCKACSGDYSVCLDNEDCAVPNSKCKGLGESFDCNLSIQLAFSGTDEHLQVLNSWYEVKNLRRYSALCPILQSSALTMQLAYALMDSRLQARMW